MSIRTRSSANTSPALKRRWPGSAVLVLLWDMAAPIAVFYILIGAGLGSFARSCSGFCFPGQGSGSSSAPAPAPDA
jgi:hypothetical protein